MAPRKPKGGRYSVTGPGVEDVSYPEVGPALSRAITASCKLPQTLDATWYVRDLDGTPVHNVYVDEHGAVFIR